MIWFDHILNYKFIYFGVEKGKGVAIETENEAQMNDTYNDEDEEESWNPNYRPLDTENTLFDEE